MSLRYGKDIIPLAKRLRRNMTPEEWRLWYEFLSRYPAKFQRQKTIDRYIADFYCFSAALVVEVDGGQHYTDEGEEYDRLRSECFHKLGLAVLRFSNFDVKRCFNEVCIAIDKAVTARVEGDLPEPEGFLRE